MRAVPEGSDDHALVLIDVFTVELVWPQEAARCGQLVAVPALAGIAPS